MIVFISPKKLTGGIIMDDCKKAEAATDWWINQMKLQCAHLYPDKVSRDDSDIIITDKSLQEDFSRFYEIMKKEIQICLEGNSYLSLTCCCFIPARQLSSLANKASISKSFFPERAAMQICNKCIKVSLNGGDLRNLLPQT